jgi:hypothetical protein
MAKLVQEAQDKKWKVYEELAAVPRSAGLASHQFLVSSQISSKEFWQRYNYWYDEKRWTIKELQ